jgi:hypothetical protein
MRKLLATKILLSAKSEWPETLISGDFCYADRPSPPSKFAKSKQSIGEVFLQANQKQP